MPWYFYNKTGTIVSPRNEGVLSTGSITLSPVPYTGTAPDGFLFCNGQQVSKATYVDLFAEIGGIFGFSDATVFTVPDLRTRMPRGIISSASGIGVAPFNNTFPYAFAAGSGGSKTHTHSLPDHTHAVSLNHGHTMPTHVHSFPLHTHTFANHQHAAGGLTIGNSNSIKANADTREDNQYYPQLAVTDETPVPGRHNHGGNVAGETGLVDSTSGSVSNNSGPNSGNASTSALNTTNVVAASGLGGAAVSSPVSQYPPYYTLSFLIKT